MRTYTDYGTKENHSPILNEKMKAIRSYDDFLQLVENEKYGWLSCIAAFHEVWRFDEDWVNDQLIEFFFDELLFYAVENVLRDRANTKKTAVAAEADTPAEKPNLTLLVM